MGRTCLVTVQGPLQFITAFNAMEWYGLVTHGTTESEAVLLVYDFHVIPEQVKPLLDAVMQLTPIKKWRRIVSINCEEMDWLTRRRQADKIKKLQQKIGSDHFDEVYAARNYWGEGSPLILQAYPRATKITYGDGFGLVARRQDISPDKPHPFNIYALYHKGKYLLKGLRYGRPPRPPTFDVAVLVLPLDFSGNYLDSLKLLVPPQAQIAGVIKRYSALLPGLHQYCQALLSDMPDPCYLYLLSLYSESGFSTANNEAALYEEVIRQHSPAGSSLLFKLHPKTFLTVADEVIKRLNGDYSIKVIRQTKYDSVPMELWSELISRCQITSFGSTALTLSYLYGKEVKLGIRDDQIDKYFKKEYRQLNREVWRCYRDCLLALNTWDQNSVLWRRHELART